MEDLDDFDLKTECDRMILAMNFIAELSLEKITETVERAHTLGPLIDPTKYRDALQRGDIDRVARLAEALKAPVAIFQEMREVKGAPA